jgi:hypothetical protein
MLNVGSVEPCVESGAVNFVNAEPVLSAAESRHVAMLQLFKDVGATFHYCMVPDKDSRAEDEPYFTFTRHRVVKFDAENEIVHATQLWSSVTGTEAKDTATQFGYHPDLRQWRQMFLDAKLGVFVFADSCAGYVIGTPVGSVPAVPFRSRHAPHALMNH